jgi:hypothetical protein
LRDGPRRFKPASTCPVLLRCRINSLPLSHTGLSPAVVELSRTVLLRYKEFKHRTYNPAQASPDGLGWSAFARRYLRNRGCFLFLEVLRCFSSLRLPRELNGFGLTVIRESWDQSPFDGFPRLIAVCHALHRLLAPRHPPHALSSLAALIPSSAWFTPGWLPSGHPLLDPLPCESEPKSNDPYSLSGSCRVPQNDAPGRKLPFNQQHPCEDATLAAAKLSKNIKPSPQRVGFIKKSEASNRWKVRGHRGLDVFSRAFSPKEEGRKKVPRRPCSRRRGYLCFRKALTSLGAEDVDIVPSPDCSG